MTVYNVGKKTQGRDFNFFEKKEVTVTEFANTPDMIIKFSTQGVMMLLEEVTGVIEYSFNGNTVHGELDSEQASKGLIFDNRTISLIWFRVKNGSSGPLTVRVDAWSK